MKDLQSKTGDQDLDTNIHLYHKPYIYLLIWIKHKPKPKHNQLLGLTNNVILLQYHFSYCKGRSGFMSLEYNNIMNTSFHLNNISRIDHVTFIFADRSTVYKRATVLYTFVLNSNLGDHDRSMGCAPGNIAISY